MMKFSNADKVRIAITGALLILFLFANIFSIRQMSKYGLKLFFYDKMSVACQIGGLPGLRSELESVISESKMPREVALAKVFKQKLENLNEPCVFLKDTTENLRAKIILYRNLRNLAFGLILLILILRLAVNFYFKRGIKKN